MFVQKLPQELKLILARKVPAAEWKMKKLLEVFLEELEARERTASTSPKTKQPHNAKRSKEYPTTRTFMSSGNAGCCIVGKRDIRLSIVRRLLLLKIGSVILERMADASIACGVAI